MDEKIIDLWKNEMVMGYHPSKIINKIDLERALLSNRLLSILAKDWKENENIYENDLSQIKKIVKKYDKYVFTKEALRFMQNFLNYIQSNFPDKESMFRTIPLLKNHPVIKSQVDELFYQSPKVKYISFRPKVVTISPESKLFHTTNNFELFERKGYKGIPYGTTWFSIDKIYDPEKTIQFHADRGPIRVIQYQWITNPKFNPEKYYFVEQHENISMPKMMDARKIDSIPKESIEKYFHEKGIEIKLKEPNLEKNILSQYGRTFRPFVVDYLKSFGLDGVIVKDNQIAIFEPDRWVRFHNIEQSDPMYLALSDLLNTYDYLKSQDFFDINEFKEHYIPLISEKNDVDQESLKILFNINNKLLS